MQDPEKITVSIYRSDKRILVAIAKKENLRDLKNHHSPREALHYLLKKREDSKGDQNCISENCPRDDGFCTEKCENCREITTDSNGEIFVCLSENCEVLPVELDLTRGYGQ